MKKLSYISRSFLLIYNQGIECGSLLFTRVCKSRVSQRYVCIISDGRNHSGIVSNFVIAIVVLQTGDGIAELFYKFVCDLLKDKLGRRSQHHVESIFKKFRLGQQSLVVKQVDADQLFERSSQSSKSVGLKNA